MTILLNHTPLAAMLLPHRDHKGRDHLLLIAKGCWQIGDGRFAPAERQSALREMPQRLRLGALELEPAQKMALKERQDEEVVWLDDDLSPPKPAFDVLVAGHVTAPDGNPHPYIDAGIRIGAHVAGLRAHPPRRWYSKWFDYHAIPLVASVRRVPLCYALADWRCGFPIDPPGWLPWIEARDLPARPGKHARQPGGFGYWPGGTAHRDRHAGTHDKAWRRDAMPDRPRDFDPRFYNTAHPDAQLPDPPAAGTPIRLVHLAEQPVIDCRFPSLELLARVGRPDGRSAAPLALRADTLILEPGQDRLSVMWRILLPAVAGHPPPPGVLLFAGPNPP